MIAYVAKDLASGVRIAESGSAKALFGHPHHPYAVGLLPRGPAYRRRGDARVSAVYAVDGIDLEIRRGTTGPVRR